MSKKEDCTLHVDPSILKLEIDFSVPRVIQIIPVNSSKPIKGEYHLKITGKGGATLF